MTKAHVDQDVCIACESCTEICPAAFTMDEDGKATFVDSGEGADCIQEAIDVCPVECISWVE